MLRAIPGDCAVLPGGCARRLRRASQRLRHASRRLRHASRRLRRASDLAITSSILVSAVALPGQASKALSGNIVRVPGELLKRF